MIRIVLLAILVWVLWRALIGWLGKKVPRRSAPGEAPALPLARCSACGTHVPRERAVAGFGGELFCSQRCRSGRQVASG